MPNRSHLLGAVGNWNTSAQYNNTIQLSQSMHRLKGIDFLQMRNSAPESLTFLHPHSPSKIKNLSIFRASCSDSHNQAAIGHRYAFSEPVSLAFSLYIISKRGPISCLIIILVHMNNAWSLEITIFIQSPNGHNISLACEGNAPSKVFLSTILIKTLAQLNPVVSNMCKDADKASSMVVTVADSKNRAIAWQIDAHAVLVPIGFSTNKITNTQQFLILVRSALIGKLTAKI